MRNFEFFWRVNFWFFWARNLFAPLKFCWQWRENDFTVILGVQRRETEPCLSHQAVNRNSVTQKWPQNRIFRHFRGKFVTRTPFKIVPGLLPFVVAVSRPLFVLWATQKSSAASPGTTDTAENQQFSLICVLSGFKSLFGLPFKPSDRSSIVVFSL